MNKILSIILSFPILVLGGINFAQAGTPVAPSITIQPGNTTVIAPATANFKVAATGTPTPTYQWMESVNGGAFTNIAGATSASYTTPATTIAENGAQYECMLTNTAGSVTSTAATLTVNPAVAPSITTQPVNNITVIAPATARFTVTATGVPSPAYQWMASVNGGAFTNINGATSSSYTTPATTISESGTQYECVVTNKAGSVTSTAANLTVNAAVSPSIITQPVNNVTVTAPATSSFSIAATGTPNPTYQWMASINGGIFTNITGATGSSYTTPATTAAQSGTQYECVVTNEAGSVTSTAATLTVNTAVPPSITTQPVNNITVVAPATANFKVIATGTPTPTYQWMVSVNGGAFSNITGATGSSYSTPATTASESGTQYECIVTNIAGSVTSTVASLTVNAPIAPSITTQPVNNVTVIAPATASFKVIATGTPTPTYQWMSSVNGGAFTNITGATSASYTTPATTTTNTGTQYECVVTNEAGSVTSSAATLTINAAVPPSITTQPSNIIIIAPATATFKVTAIGTPTPTYQWMDSVNGGAFINISGATSASYTTPATTTTNSGTQYECVVTNEAGSVTSNAVTLTVNPTQVPPSITTQPLNITVIAPATAALTVAAIGTPTPTYQWMQSVSGGAFTNIAGATKSSYTTPATTTANSGTQYECVVTNAAGSVTSNVVTLTVNPAVPPSITTQPVNNITVIAPATATFSVAATGTPTPTYQWQLELPGSGTYTAITGAKSSSYTTPATTIANSGTQYECVITNEAGSVTSTPAGLTVNIAVAPSITTQPVNNVTVTAPATANFKVVATGTPTPTYQWMASVNGGAFINITGATGSSYTTPATTTANSGTQYECVITNEVGSVTSTAAMLTVNAAMAPTIITQPVDNITVTAPATATFRVTATGTPAPTYQWQQEVPGAGIYTSITGATGSSYKTPATTVAESGTQYECVITNEAGSVTSNAASLTVNPALVPNITTQPVSVTVIAPATATFKVVATGTPTPTYQWMVSVNAGTFTNITGATGSSYTTPATTIANSGTQYECAVTNEAGTVTSNAVTLTVTTIAPTIITQPVNATVAAPATATFTITATGTPTPSYQWMESVNGGAFTIITGATGSSYATSATTIANNGTQFECVVRNSSGSITSNPVILTVNLSLQPVVAITSPANNAIVPSSSNLTITVNASEAGGTISSVNYYNGSSWLGTSTTAPFSYTATNLPVGIYNISAQAIDANGNSTYSTPVKVLVSAQPAVAIISPINQGSFTTGSINITANTDNSYGAISNVAFYNGPTLLGTVSSASAAFTYSWTNVPAGTYDITAIATNATGSTATSSPVTFTINSANFTTALDDNIASKTDARGNVTSYQYDNLNRLTKTTFADNSTVTSSYDLFGNQISVTDQRGNTLTKTYDAYERLSQAKDPLNGITQFNYDTEGRLLTLTDANNNPTTYTYDPNGKVLTQNNALNFTTTFTYDPVGNVATRQDANGKITNYTYDPLNRLTNTAYSDGSSVVNVYDALGRKTSMTDSTGQTTYAYDALSRLLTKTSPGTNNTITYTYDSEGNRLTSVDQNNRTIANTFDALNRLSTVTDPNGTTDYGYDAVSNKISVAMPNGIAESYTYDPLNRVLTDVNAKGSTVISSFSNVYDIAGMITKKTLQDGSWTVYSYDALNRLLEETKQTSVSTIYDYAYTYDLVGNRLTWTKNTTLGNFWSVDSLNMPAQVLTNLTNANYGNTAIPTQTVTLARNYAYDAANRLNNWNYGINIYSANFPIQTDTYTYDNNGNRLTKQTVLTGQESSPQQTKYSYDFENRLNQLQYVNIPNITGTQTDNFTYNAEGLRTQAVRNTTTDNYLYDGSNVLVRRDGSGNTTKSYTRGLDFGGGIGSIIALSITGSNPIAQYYDYNDLGSVADLTTSTGESASDYSYDAFGNLLTPQASGDTNRYLFSTKEFETRSGLSYFGGRYYDPEVGRWATPDPLGFVDGVNPYLYVNDNPVNLVDPYGLCGQNIGERVLDWANDNIFNNPELAPLFALPGVGALGMEAQEAESLAANTAENAAEIEENYQRFVTNLPAKAETPTTIPFGDSSVAFQAKVPATNIPGSYSVYEKQVNSYGITENYSKTTYAPDGTIVHVKYKYIRTQ